MTDPIFPINPLGHSPGRVFTIEPYRTENGWVFDDDTVGLVREPFVSNIGEMIEPLVAHIANAGNGFRLIFSELPFDGYQTSLSWLRADPVEGHWYRAHESPAEGWLCPALFLYFQKPPEKIFVRVEAK